MANGELSWKGRRRGAGILLHPSSLPGPFSVGTFGESAYRFVDFLRDSGQRYWQILPLNPFGSGFSPYQSPSVWAGCPLYIDPDLLVNDELLTADECCSAQVGSPDLADYALAQERQEPLLRLAFSRGREMLSRDVAIFYRENGDWLSDHALFSAAQRHFGGAALQDWPDGALLRREPGALGYWQRELAEEISFEVFLQFLFFRQWRALREYANQNGIFIIGDLPIYCSSDSVQVWSRPELFRVDEHLRPEAYSGVPADGFSPSGQFWGNPLYRWEAHEKSGFSWWRARLRHALTLCDIVRLDHFRGFHSYWEIPLEAKAASEGFWREGPGESFISLLREEAFGAGFIAEDLGDLSPEARRFTEDSGLPGMRVLTDAFGSGPDNPFLPHNCPINSIIYTSTHDSPTFLEWYREASPDARQFASRYLRLRLEEGISWGAAAGAWESSSVLSMAPMQDILGLGEDARMNRPSTVGGRNWRWRVRREAFNAEVSSRLRELTEIYGRL